MLSIPLASWLAGLGALVLVELGFLLYRKRFPRFLEHLRYHSFALALAVWVTLRALRTAPVYETFFPWVAFVTFVVTVDLGYRLIKRLVLAQLRDEAGRLLVPKLMRDLIGWVLMVVAVVWAGWSIVGIDPQKFLLPTTVISAVLGFAFQDVLKNVFAGLALQTEAPFETGDWLLVDGQPQQVIEMTWRSTHLRDNLGHDFREPNANLVNARIENLGSGEVEMAFEVEVGVVYGAPPRQVKDALEAAARSCPWVVGTPAPIGLLLAFGDSGVIYRLRYWSRDVRRVARLHDQVATRVWYELKRRHFVIPFPIRTVEFKKVDEIAHELSDSHAARALELFGEVDFLAALPAEALQRMSGAATHHHFDAGEQLVAEDDEGGSLFVLSRGRVKVAKSGREIGASSVELATLEAGQFFGEMSLLTGAPRSATVTAVDAVEAFELDRAALAPILQADPTLAEPLARVLGERVAATLERFEDRRDELSRAHPVDHRSLLGKIRHLFRLG